MWENLKEKFRDFYDWLEEFMEDKFDIEL